MNKRIVAILLLAAVLNLWGAGWGAPDPVYAPTDAANHTLHPQALVHPDAFHFAARAFRMAATGDWNPHFFENPSLYVNVNAVLHLLSGAAAGHPVPADHPEREYAPFPPYVMARVVSALAGVLLVAFAFAAARLAFGRRAAELAALLAAVSPVVVQHSHYATTNVTAAALAAGALWASLRVLSTAKSRTWINGVYVLAGLLVGLAGSAKYNAGVVGGVYVLAGLVMVYRRRAWRPFVLGLAMIGVGFLVGTPYALLDVRKFWADFRYITSEYVGGQGYPESSHGLGFHWLHIAWFGVGPAAAALSVLGAALALRQRRGLRRNSPALYAALMLAYAAAYSLVVLTARRLGDHLTVPMIGVTAAFAGYGAAWALKRLRGPAVWAFVLLIVAVPLAYAVRFDASAARPDTRERAQAWVYAHVRPGEHVHLVGPYNVPLDPAAYTTSQDFGHDYQAPEAIRAAGTSVVIVSDARSFLYNAAESWIPSDIPALTRDLLAAYDAAMVEAARFERQRWPGDLWPLDTAAYWHNPTIIVYCFPDVCEDVIGPR